MSFLVDFLRFEAARSSKVAISGLWIVPNSTLSWRESLWRVEKKRNERNLTNWPGFINNNNNNNNNNLILILGAFHEMIKRALHDFYL